MRWIKAGPFCQAVLLYVAPCFGKKQHVTKRGKTVRKKCLKCRKWRIITSKYFLKGLWNLKGHKCYRTTGDCLKTEVWSPAIGVGTSTSASINKVLQCVPQDSGRLFFLKIFMLGNVSKYFWCGYHRFFFFIIYNVVGQVSELTSLVHSRFSWTTGFI